MSNLLPVQATPVAVVSVLATACAFNRGAMVAASAPAVPGDLRAVLGEPTAEEMHKVTHIVLLPLQADAVLAASLQGAGGWGEGLDDMHPAADAMLASGEPAFCNSMLFSDRQGSKGHLGVSVCIIGRVSMGIARASLRSQCCICAQLSPV